MNDRDKFITEAMGGKQEFFCFVDGEFDKQNDCVRQDSCEYDRNTCVHGGTDEKPEQCEYWKLDLTDGTQDFSTWGGFGRLMSIDHEIVPRGYLRGAAHASIYQCTAENKTDEIPDRFANAVYEFLKDRQ